MVVKTIEILGTGCSKCQALERSAREAVESLGIDVQVQKVDKLEEIIQRGVMLTPALVIDGEVLSAGKVLSADQIRALIE